MKQPNRTIIEVVATFLKIDRKTVRKYFKTNDLILSSCVGVIKDQSVVNQITSNATVTKKATVPKIA